MARSEKYYGPDFNSLERQDPEIAAVVISELERQRHDLQISILKFTRNFIKNFKIFRANSAPSCINVKQNWFIIEILKLNGYLSCRHANWLFIVKFYI
jgi:hypothetical protein